MKLKTIQRNVPAKTEEISLDLDQVRFSIGIADRDTPGSSGGAGSMHITITAKDEVRRIVLNDDGAHHFESVNGGPISLTEELTPTLTFEQVRSFLADLAEKALAR